MKAKLTAAILLLTTTLLAQQPFEGTIRYRLHAPGEKQDATLIVSFGKARLKIEFLEPSKTAPSDYLLLALDSGIVYVVNTESKSFRLRRLLPRSFHTALPSAKTIAGHNTIPAFLPNGDVMNFFGGSLPHETVLYVADDLFFPVPESYGRAPELAMVQNGKIVLGADISVSDRYRNGPAESYDTATKETFTVTAEATDIVPKTFAAAELEIPVGYTSQNVQDYVTDTTAKMDPAYTTTDTVVRKKNTPSGNGRKKNTTKPSVSKESAIRRKQR